MLANANKTPMLFDLLLSELRSVNWTQFSTLAMLANICLHESLQAGFTEKATTTGEIKAKRGNLNEGDNRECFQGTL